MTFITFEDHMEAITYSRFALQNTNWTAQLSNPADPRARINKTNYFDFIVWLLPIKLNNTLESETVELFASTFQSYSSGSTRFKYPLWIIRGTAWTPNVTTVTDLFSTDVLSHYGECTTRLQSCTAVYLISALYCLCNIGNGLIRWLIKKGKKNIDHP